MDFLRPHLFKLLVLLPICIFLFRVFESIPFLQHEILGLAYWWNHPNFNFLQTLFDGQKMDVDPGRFRYVEYLAEAFYWKLSAFGILPRDLYDYFGILSVLCLTFLLLKIAKNRNLGRIETLLIISFFLLSTHACLLGAFHFRKAKPIIAILLCLQLGITDIKPKHSQSLQLFILGLLGFLTDPFYILCSPVLSLSLDIAGKSFQRSRSLLTGMMGGFLLVLLLNGVIGPKFSPYSQLPFSGIPNIPNGMLSITNLPAFPKIVSQIFVPGIGLEPELGVSWVEELKSYGKWKIGTQVGWILSLTIFGLLVLQFRRKFFEWGLTLGLIFIFPLGAFLLVPVNARATYSGYYGFPYLVVVTVWMMSLVSFLQLNFGKLAKGMFYSLLVFFIFVHQVNQTKVFETWIEHSLFPINKTLYLNDYQKFATLRDYFRSNPDGNNSISLKTPEFTMNLGPTPYSYPGMDGTDLVYIGFPLFFKKEFERGQFHLRFETDSKPPPPQLYWWSYTLFFPYQLKPVKPGTLVDLYWDTADARKCLLQPGARTDLTGETQVRIEKDTVFHIRCEGPGGTLNDSFTVQVVKD